MIALTEQQWICLQMRVCEMEEAVAEVAAAGPAIATWGSREHDLLRAVGRAERAAQALGQAADKITKANAP
jgi:hypothetical protein